ncbi:MAG: efflux RND transporter permease subunit [Firmicutes bacterium]|nr:efflux RND transporter permease subunit [Bacillota bacterium]
MISKLAVKRPVTMIMVLLAIVMLGSVAVFSIPQALLPDIEYPYAIAMVTYPGAGPEEIDNMVTSPMESALASVEGTKNIMSVSSENMSMVAMEFNMNVDMNFVTLDMREKISMIQSALPEDASSPTIMKMNMDSMPVMQIYISSDKPLPELAEYIEENIISKIERVSGVASVDMVGATDDVVNIIFDQDKLNGYGVTMATVNSILSAENISYPSGEVSNGSNNVIIRTYGEFKSVQEIEEIPITLNDGSIITIQDIATIEQTESDVESISRIDGSSAIGLYISKSSDANIVEVSDKVQQAMERLEKEFGEDISMNIGFDQSDFIRDSIKSVAQTAVQGAILAIIVIFFFLRNIRSTLVIGISIPASVLATFGVMKLMGMSLNMLTLGALTLAIGMVVDNSVVVLENIFRRNKEGLNSEDAAIKGSQEVILAVMASTLTSVVVYLPIALSGGLAGMMFKDFSYTIIAALVCSLIVAVTVVPMLCSKLLDNSVSQDYIRIGRFFYRYKIITLFTRFIDWLIASYRRLIRGALRRRKTVLVLFVAMFASSVVLVSLVGWELMPEMDEGSFSVSVDMPYGTTIEAKDAYMSEIENYILELPELEHATVNIGGSVGMSTSSSNSISVTLKSLEERNRSTKEVMNDVKDHFKDLAGAEIEYSITSSMGTSALGGSDLSLNITGDDYNIVSENAMELARELQSLECISEVGTDAEEGSPEVRVVLNRSTAAHYGITSYQVATGLSQALSGTKATELKVDGETINIKLILADRYSNSVEDMKGILISTASGAQVPVGQLANFEYDNSPASITKTNQQVQTAVNITFTDNIEIREATEQVEEAVSQFMFDDGVAYNKDGLEAEMAETFMNLLIALVVSLVLVYIVLASQFESVILPIMVMMSIPFAMSGAFLAMFLTGKSLSMPSFIGLIMLIGIVVNNAIILVEFINQNKKNMGRNDAIIEAGCVRMRPILMTTLTTVIGMIPMALGIGDGMEMMSPMAISIIGGLFASTIITLFLIPILYAIVDDFDTKRSGRRAAKKKINLYREALWLAKGAARREKTAERKARKNS